MKQFHTFKVYHVFNIKLSETFLFILFILFVNKNKLLLLLINIDVYLNQFRIFDVDSSENYEDDEQNLTGMSFSLWMLCCLLLMQSDELKVPFEQGILAKAIKLNLQILVIIKKILPQLFLDALLVHHNFFAPSSTDF